MFLGPYYRMPIMRSKHSTQHELLIHLELSSYEVYYVAPEFYADDELADYYSRRVVFDNSALFRPAEIGHLPGDRPHYVAFDHRSAAYACSDEPGQIERIFGGQSFTLRTATTSRDRSSAVNEGFFEKITDGMLQVFEENGLDAARIRASRLQLSEREDLAANAEYAA